MSLNKYLDGERLWDFHTINCTLEEVKTDVGKNNFYVQCPRDGEADILPPLRLNKLDFSEFSIELTRQTDDAEHFCTFTLVDVAVNPLGITGTGTTSLDFPAGFNSRSFIIVNLTFDSNTNADPNNLRTTNNITCYFKRAGNAIVGSELTKPIIQDNSKTTFSMVFILDENDAIGGNGLQLIIKKNSGDPFALAESTITIMKVSV